MKMGVSLPFCLDFRPFPLAIQIGPRVGLCCTSAVPIFFAPVVAFCVPSCTIFSPQSPNPPPAILQFLPLTASIPTPRSIAWVSGHFFPRKVCQFFRERSAIFAEKSEVFRAKVSNFFRGSLQFFLEHFFSHSGRGAKNVLLFIWFLQFL